jgi:glycine/D-amino acid oxidase-like deaminating enzyme
MNDFLVIGGGIAGLSAAARLSELGRVTLLEREDATGYHASGRSAALFEESYGLPSVVALNRASRAFLEEGGYLAPRGLMMVAGADRADRFAADLATMEMAEIGIDAACDLCPILNPAAVARAAWHAAAWDIDTGRLMQDFARRVRAAGGAVLTRSPATAIRRTAGGWTVTTPGGDHAGRILVNAAGAWADGIARMAGIAPLGLMPLRRSMARIPAPAGRDPARWPMLIGAGEDWYMKPDAGALIVSPAEEEPCEPMDAWPDDMVLAEGLARYEAHVTAPVVRLLASWAGLRTFAPDRQLVLGPDPADPAFIWCAGQGGYGFQTAPAAAALLADRLAGRAPAIGQAVADATDPARLRR